MPLSQAFPFMHPYACFEVSGNVQDAPRASRNRVTTRAQDNRFRNQHIRDRFLLATRTAAATDVNHGRHISAQTVINRLKDHGIRPRRPYVGPKLLPRHRRARLQWYRTHLAWLARQWNRGFSSQKSQDSPLRDLMDVNAFIDVPVSVLATHV